MVSGVTNLIKKLLTYKEKQEYDEFELLENEKSRGSKLKRTDPLSPSFTYSVPDDSNPPPSFGKSAKSDGKNEESEKDFSEKSLSADISHNLNLMRKEFSLPQNQDVIISEFNVARKIKAAIVFIDGMVDREILNNFVLRQLMDADCLENYKAQNLMDYLKSNVLAVHDTKKEKEPDQIITHILNGLTALFVDGNSDCLLIESRGYEKRSVEKPITENIVRGSHEAFNENLRTNVTLIRRIVRNKNLVTEIFPIGKTNNSSCAVMYLKNIANPEIVKEVRKRIKSIDFDYIHGDGMLEQMIEDQPFMLSSRALATERPDGAASFLTHGQVIIIADGTPYALVVPITFFGLFHTSEDINISWQWGTVIRSIRFVAYLISAFLPGIYISLILYHQQMIPTELLTSIERSSEFIPLPVVVELLTMEFAFDLIREAGERVPGIIGPTIGIIGALILGQAAVQANIVSPIMIIIVAITGLGNFAIPNYSVAVSFRMYRYLIIFAGAVAGFYGISAMLVVILGLACSIKSFGVPYFSPITPKAMPSKDLFIRRPLWVQRYRPDEMNTKDIIKAGSSPNWYTKKRKIKND